MNIKYFRLTISRREAIRAALHLFVKALFFNEIVMFVPINNAISEGANENKHNNKHKNIHHSH